VPVAHFYIDQLRRHRCGLSLISSHNAAIARLLNLISIPFSHSTVCYLIEVFSTAECQESDPVCSRFVLHVATTISPLSFFRTIENG
jgi:hypothetical protein